MIEDIEFYSKFTTLLIIKYENNKININKKNGKKNYLCLKFMILSILKNQNYGNKLK